MLALRPPLRSLGGDFGLNLEVTDQCKQLQFTNGITSMHFFLKNNSGPRKKSRKVNVNYVMLLVASCSPGTLQMLYS